MQNLKREFVKPARTEAYFRNLFRQLLRLLLCDHQLILFIFVSALLEAIFDDKKFSFKSCLNTGATESTTL